MLYIKHENGKFRTFKFIYLADPIFDLLSDTIKYSSKLLWMFFFLIILWMWSLRLCMCVKVQGFDLNVV